jgi:hypothetical protein
VCSWFRSATFLRLTLEIEEISNQPSRVEVQLSTAGGWEVVRSPARETVKLTRLSLILKLFSPSRLFSLGYVESFDALIYFKMTSYFNLSGTLNAFRILRDPAICLPHATISSFAQLPVPLSKAFQGQNENEADIRAVVLDKDNCFAIPHANEIHEPFKVRPISVSLVPTRSRTMILDRRLIGSPLKEKFKELRAAYPGSKLLIVSNTAGTSSDIDYREAALLEKNTGVTVLKHDTKVGRHESLSGNHSQPVARSLTFFQFRNLAATKKYCGTFDQKQTPE